MFEQDSRIDRDGAASVHDYVIDDAYQGNEAVQMVQRAEEKGTPYALVFMDVRMPPGIDGVETVERIWQINPYIEVVICTAYSDYSWEEIVRRIGTSDRMLFLKKPFYAVEVKQMALSLTIKYNLNQKVREIIANLEQQVEERTKQIQNVMNELKSANSELQSKNQRLADMVERDSLTGLYNHSAVHHRLDEWFAAAERNFFPITVIMLDIDNFKQINDCFGHQAGDEILLKLAGILKHELKTELENDYEIHNELRKYDVAARYGGDEFMLILPYCGPDDASRVANRLMKRFTEIKFCESPNMTLTVSMGVSVADNSSKIKNSKEMVKLADEALYTSKAHGKNCVTISTP